MRRCFLLLLPAFFICCTGGSVDFRKYSPHQKRIRTELTYLKDGFGRYVYINGLNVSGSTKFPSSEDSVSYKGKPFPLEDADRWFNEIKRLGFNAIRLLIIWEGIEHEGKGKYDKDYLDYIEGIVERAAVHGIFVLIDMHQDLFSRHLTVNFNENPPYGGKGSLESMILSLLPPYTDKVRGDGAPKWVVQACLKEKNLDSAKWGIFKSLGSFNADVLGKIVELYLKLFPPGRGGEPPEWVGYFIEKLKEIGEFDVTESSDMLPFTFWGINAALSLDVERSFACFFAGDKIYPGYKIEGQSVKDYLQEAYINAYLEVVKRVKKFPNIIGYDLMNEPIGIFALMSAIAAYFNTGIEDSVKTVLTTLLGAENGALAWDIIRGLNLLPQDRSQETMKKWGFEGVDLLAVLGLNYGFDRNYLQPFYEKLGKKIQDEDPDAVIWIELSGSIGTLLPPGGTWEINMTRPEGIDQVVFAPHWYPDIYPFIGFNMPPRVFTPEEIKFRDYEGSLKGIAERSAYSLGNVPVVFGEFGTYFNFNGIEESIKNNYEVSAQILDNYYEGFESLFMHRMLWCFSPENDYKYGDGWNKEDFSIIDPNGKPRGEKAFSRPYPRALSGKPVSMRFYSDYHYFDPDKGVVNPLREFELKFESKETDAPTEIFVPEIQYPDGFYLYLTDGYAVYDHEEHIVYYFPSEDAPGHIHGVTIKAPLAGQVHKGWNYFFYKDMSVDGK